MKEQDQVKAFCQWLGIDYRENGGTTEQLAMIPNIYSLDVLHSLEEKLDCDQRAEFYNRVAVMVGNGFDLLHAKPELRRKAILQTLNLWREDSNT